jgi:uncharacterized membrane protein
MRRLFMISTFLVLALILSGTFYAVHAQEGQSANETQELSLVTTYPSQYIGLGESISFSLRLSTGPAAQTVSLSTKDLPEGWTSTFRGGGRVIDAVYVEPDADVTVEWKLEPPADVESGKYEITAFAQSEAASAELTVTLTVMEKVPPRLTFSAELPTLNGTPSTTFRYNASLKNEGDEELSVTLQAETTSSFRVTFKLSGQEVTNIPLAADETKQLSIEVQPYGVIPAGSYPIFVHAMSGDVQADLTLTAEVTGEPDLSITTADGRLSGQANAGRDTTFEILLSNQGTASAQGISMTSSEPTDWSVGFEPKEIPEIPSGQQYPVKVTVHPAEKALAGDYQITFRGASANGPSTSVDFRITVLTSTLWGIVGVALVAVAVGVVALAVIRFGRR